MNTQTTNTRRTARRILHTVACATAVLSLAACEESFEPSSDEAKAAELAPVPAPAVSAHNAVSSDTWEQITRAEDIDMIPALAFDPTAPIDPRQPDLPTVPDVRRTSTAPSTGGGADSARTLAPPVSADNVVAEEETWTVPNGTELIDINVARALDARLRAAAERFEAEVEIVVYIVDEVPVVAPMNHSCGDGLVLPLADVCNSKQDCADDSDEAGCR